MSHFASPGFWKCYHRLPAHIRKLADENFSLLKGDTVEETRSNLKQATELIIEDRRADILRPWYFSPGVLRRGGNK